MSYKQMLKNTDFEVTQQFNRKVYNNKPVFGQYKNNKYNNRSYVRLQGTTNRDICLVTNCNGIQWEENWERFYTTDTPPGIYTDLYSNGYFQSN